MKKKIKMFLYSSVSSFLPISILVSCNKNNESQKPKEKAEKINIESQKQKMEISSKNFELNNVSTIETENQNKINQFFNVLESKYNLSSEIRNFFEIPSFKFTHSLVQKGYYDPKTTMQIIEYDWENLTNSGDLRNWVNSSNLNGSLKKLKDFLTFSTKILYSYYQINKPLYHNYFGNYQLIKTDYWYENNELEFWKTKDQFDYFIETYWYLKNEIRYKPKYWKIDEFRNEGLKLDDFSWYNRDKIRERFFETGVSFGDEFFELEIPSFKEFLEKDNFLIVANGISLYDNYIVHNNKVYDYDIIFNFSYLKKYYLLVLSTMINKIEDLMISLNNSATNNNSENNESTAYLTNLKEKLTILKKILEEIENN